MFGAYVWKAGATAPGVVADLLAIASGEPVSALSAACDKTATTIDGAPSGWAVHDAAYGVLSAPSVADAGVTKLARIAHAGGVVQLSTADAWNAATHAATNAVDARAVSLPVAVPGAIAFVMTPEVFLLAAADWSSWHAVCEIKRDGPLLRDTTAPNWVLMGAEDGMTAEVRSPRLKNVADVGDATNLALDVASAYGPLAGATTRDRQERLYIPMGPVVTTVGQVPVGELVGVLAAGGYGMSGDYLIDAESNSWLLAQLSDLLLAVKRA